MNLTLSQNYSVKHDFMEHLNQRYIKAVPFDYAEISKSPNLNLPANTLVEELALNQKFIDIFQNYKGSNQPTLQQLAAAIQRCKKNLPYRENRTYLQIREQELLHTSTHYLIYGSEYIHMLANEIKPFSYSYQNHLKSCDIATILNIHVPIKQITNFESFLLELMKMVLDHQITEDHPLDLSIHTAVCIKPKDIYHPDTYHLIDYHQP